MTSDRRIGALTKLTITSVLAILLGGCSSTAKPASPAFKSGGGFSTAILMGQDTASVHSYKEAKVTECMRGSGFTYQPAAFTPFEVPDTRAVRQKAGFGFSDPALYSQSVSQQNDRDAEVQSSDEGEQQGFESARVACQEQAGLDLAALVDQFMQTLSPDDQQRLEAIRNFDTPEFDAAQKAWSECMAVADYEFASQPAMFQYASSTFADPSYLPDEIKLALADWDCSQTDDVAGVVADAYAQLDAQLNDAFDKLLQSQAS